MPQTLVLCIISIMYKFDIIKSPTADALQIRIPSAVRGPSHLKDPPHDASHPYPLQAQAWATEANPLALDGTGDIGRLLAFLDDES